jgi:hypothetical protein
VSEGCASLTSPDSGTYKSIEQSAIDLVEKMPIDN